MQNDAEPPGQGLVGWSLRLFSASEHGPRITDSARITDCCRIKRSTGLPDYGFFQDLGRCVSGQVLASVPVVAPSFGRRVRENDLNFPARPQLRTPRRPLS
eukprot:15485315-Alexandrium_andersonii.AAC.1